MQSLTQQLHAGLMQPEMTQLLLPPYETTAPYDSRVSYDPSVSYDTTVPYTTTVPYDTRAWDRQGAYLQDWVAVSMPAGTNDQKDPTPQETKQPQEWKAVENEPEEPQGTLEWPRPPQQTTLLLIVCGLFLFLVLTGMPAAFYI
ncbi:small integral membrane protein 17 [Pipistrellus kuhlii]|uniref:small integral membrane protein 17 n=1 Tax=Pipistrellus kuhlii TaxID=59472 RepID=UPI00174EE20A|nr:small integral membrane protein 17 [Pipistrellus kuhlii]